jgi:hypothetical protein
VRRGGGGTGGHRADQHAASGRSGQLFAMLSSAGGPLRVTLASVRVASIRVDAAFNAWLRRTRAVKLHDAQIVGVVQIIEFRRAQYLRFLVESGVVAEVQVIEFAELIKRDDVGDFVAMDL